MSHEPSGRSFPRMGFAAGGCARKRSISRGHSGGFGIRFHLLQISDKFSEFHREVILRPTIGFGLGRERHPRRNSRLRRLCRNSRLRRLRRPRRGRLHTCNNFILPLAIRSSGLLLLERPGRDAVPKHRAAAQVATSADDADDAPPFRILRSGG